MRRMMRPYFFVILLSLPFLVRAEAEKELPDFAVARLSIGKMGVFLEQNGALANQVVANAGPLAKIVLANQLFKLPVDESLNFQGPAHIYIVPPLIFSAAQDTATILPVSDAEKVKKNALGAYGDPVKQDGDLMEFEVPQPIPLPNKPLFIKVTKDKAFLAPSAELLKQLEAVSNVPPPQNADAELRINVSAVKKLYEPKIRDALNAGALLAAQGEIAAMNKLGDQIDAIQETLWEIATIDLRLKFDEGSKNISAELAIVPVKGSKLALSLDNPPPGLAGKDTVLLATNAPINAAFRMNALAVHAWLKKHGIERNEDTIKRFYELCDGEVTLAIDPALQGGLQTLRVRDGDPFLTKIDTAHQALAELIGKNFAGDADAPAVAKNVSTIDHKGTPVTVRQIEARNKDGSVASKNLTGAYFAHARSNDDVVLAAGTRAEVLVRNFLNARETNAQIPPEVRDAFDAPPPGTLLLISAKLLELVRLAVIETLPQSVPPERIVGGLNDAPVFASIFINGGQAGLRLRVPGVTLGSLYAVTRRLRGQNINVLDLVTGNKPKEELPGNIPPPPPLK